MDEFALIARHFTRAPRAADVVLGVGDDAAILAAAPGVEWLATVDMMVEGRHFLEGADPRHLGHKLMAVNLSDIAAMGGRPRFALLAVALPADDSAWLAAFSHGLFALADAHGVDVVGGDTTRGPRNLCLTLLGDVPAGTALRRSGACVGDDVYVSGTLGDAMLALAAIEGRTAIAAPALASLRARLDAPVPRVALGQALRGAASAAIDVSDGLSGDLGHLLERSGVGAVVELASLPRSAALDAKLRSAERDAALAWLVAGGDDYELCFTAPASHREAVAAASRAAGVAVARIGRIVAGDALILQDERGQPLAPLPRGFDHFRAGGG
ncbi:MAG TPA: thiamine-phosphate kinase [Casimicrobiaceae bacterium]|jgi:thiamine-monophosphate kinase